MMWIGKHPPIYIWEGDTWQRQPDGKIFSLGPDHWFAEDGEIVPLQKKTIRCYEKHAKQVTDE